MTVMLCIRFHPPNCAHTTSLPILVSAYFMKRFGNQSEIAGM